MAGGVVMTEKDVGVIQFLKKYANLTDEELVKINEELSATWDKLLKILSANVNQLNPEQMDADYFFWLCFSVGMFRENQFMKDTFGGRDINKTRALAQKMEKSRTKYIA